MMTAGLRRGDTLVLLAKGDLGRGREITAVRRALSGRGVEIEIVGLGGPPNPRGRPGFSPSEEHDRELHRLWMKPALYTPGYVIQAAEDRGHNVTRQQLYYRYGSRTARS